MPPTRFELVFSARKADVLDRTTLWRHNNGKCWIRTSAPCAQGTNPRPLDQLPEKQVREAGFEPAKPLQIWVLKTHAFDHTRHTLSNYTEKHIPPQMWNAEYRIRTCKALRRCVLSALGLTISHNSAKNQKCERRDLNPCLSLGRRTS